MKTIFLKLERDCYVFQQGLILKLEDRQMEGQFEGKTLTGYPLPDIGDGTPGMLPAGFATPVEGWNEQEESYYGKCVLSQLRNFHKDGSQNDAEAIQNIGLVEARKVDFIYYPDCQQLKFHLPKYGWDAGQIRLIDAVSGDVLEAMPVSHKLSGSTQILWDTLPFKPGFYTLEADWPGGWTHQIKFIKFQEGFPKATTYVSPPGNVTMVQDGSGHRLFDSNGVEIDNGRSQISAAQESILGKSGRRIEYTEQGRAGNIYYYEDNLKLDFDWEFAFGDGVVLIFVPNPEQWETATKTPRARRQEILEFVAERVIRDKAPGCRYIIGDGYIDILKK